jgi:hypothetical protein
MEDLISARGTCALEQNKSFWSSFLQKARRFQRQSLWAHAAAGETSLKLDTVSALRFGAELQFQHTEITRVSTLALLKKHMK